MQAVKAYARALKLQPKYEAAAVALSSSLQQQNKIDECIEWLVSSDSIMVSFV